MKAYIVIGHTGEYGGYAEWLVACYTDLERAVQHRDLANEWAKQLGGTDWEDSTHRLARPNDKHYEMRDALDEGRIVCPCDPLFWIDYTGTQYKIMEIDLDPEDLSKLEPSVVLTEGE